jgi:general L-amino acid transport system permease protein
MLTLLVCAIFCEAIPPLVKWAFIDSLWLSSGEGMRSVDGACWSIIPANIRFIIFGFYPFEEQWRPLVAMVMLVALLFYSRNRKHWNKRLAYVGHRPDLRSWGC